MNDKVMDTDLARHRGTSGYSALSLVMSIVGLVLQEAGLGDMQ